jgi:maltose phosphorylase
MVNAVNWLYTRIELDGEMLDIARCQISDFRQELDFKTGQLQREFTWKTTIWQNGSGSALRAS